MPPESSTATSSFPIISGEQRGVAAPPERGVQVDEVDPLGAVALPGQRGLHRIAVPGLGARLAPDQAHGLSTDDVHRGQ